MKYTKEISVFKADMKEAYKVNDCSRPVKGSKVIKIVIQEFEEGTARVELCYREEFRRMFGKFNFVDVEVFEGDLKAACEAARELKKETGLPIKFYKYEPMEMLAF